MNPAISLAMWRFGVFPGAGVIPYTIAQLLGSVLGVVAARGVWGNVVAEPPVVYGALQPGPGWSTWELFAIEVFGMAVIVFLVGLCLAVQRLTPFVPWIVRGSRGDRDRGARNNDRRQSEPRPPVWARCRFGTNAVPYGCTW